MRVLRVETEDGTGMYHAMGSWLSIVIGLQGDDTCPAPWADNLVTSDGEELFFPSDFQSFHFGFRDYEQFTKWTSQVKEGAWEAVQSLTQTKLFMSEYEVPDQHVAKGNRQVAFVRREATLVRREPLMGDNLEIS